MSTKEPTPKLNIHSQSSASEKDTYRRQHNFKLPRAKLPKKWITDEFDRQDIWNSGAGAGVDVDFVIEEYRRCHPDMTQEQEERMEVIIQELEQTKKKKKKKKKKKNFEDDADQTRIIVDWGFAKKWFRSAHPAVDR